MKHASLFSGIGGFDLAAQWMGWENIFQVEIDPFCQKVLEKNFPTVKRYGDIKQFNGAEYRGTIDILTGGFPCQPFSVAGDQQGKEDDRYLWPEMLRVIREITPSFIVGENVTGIIGLALDEVLASLEAEGYKTETFIIPACAVGAPHRRDRVWIVAHSDRNRQSIKPIHEYSRQGELGTFTNSGSNFIQGSQNIGSLRESGEKREKQSSGFLQSTWEEFPTQPPICRGNDGVPNRVERIKSLGNAVVPQVVYEIFKAIEAIHE